ncbi:MAG TPA: polyphenol oxidase family protein [Polyangiaceae bacterium]|nr:polyphenol oxidase family protein [Polyangiaceae bacterium]
MTRLAPSSIHMALLQSKLLSEAGFRHGFPERGTDDRELMRALGAARIAGARQVHGACAVEGLDTEGKQADAVIGRARRQEQEQDRGLAVGVRVADCVPVLVGDLATGDVAAIHAGWRGIVAGVVRSGLERLGGRSIVAAIGPCIGRCCFEVGHDVADAIASACPGVQVVIPFSAETDMVDLRIAVRGQLRALDVDDSSIDDVVGCTKHDSRFHSFRRDGPSSGRMLAAIAVRSYF